MAVFQFKCPQCGQMVEADDSVCGQAAGCPYCEESIVVPRKQSMNLASDSQSSVTERNLVETHPAIVNYIDNFIGVFLMGFCMRPILWIFRVRLNMMALEGMLLLVTFLIVKLICCTTKYTVTNKKVVSAAGILATTTTEVFHRDIRAISIQRSLFQRLFNLADILIATAATGGAEIILHGVPEWKRVQGILDSYRRDHQSVVSQ